MSFFFIYKGLANNESFSFFFERGDNLFRLVRGVSGFVRRPRIGLRGPCTYFSHDALCYFITKPALACVLFIIDVVLVNILSRSKCRIEEAVEGNNAFSLLRCD